MLHAGNKLGMGTVPGYRTVLVMLSYGRFLLAVIHGAVPRHAPAFRKWPTNNTRPVCLVPTLSPLLFKVNSFLVESAELILESKRYMQDRASCFNIALTLFLLPSWKYCV